MPLSLRDAAVRLKKLDDVELSMLCLLNFPEVHQKFSDGMRRDKKAELLLDYIGRNPELLPQLHAALDEYDPVRAKLNAELERFEQGLARPAAVEDAPSRAVRPAGGGAAAPQTLQAITQRFALLVGVGEYLDAGIRDLPLTVQDVLALETALAAAGYTVVTLHGGLADEARKPTRGNIIGRLGQMAANTGPGDLLLVYFGGHGALDNKDQRPYLLARDTYLNDLEETGVDLLKFQEKLRGAGAQARVLLLDACHSGSGRSDDRMSAEFQRLAFQEAEGLAVLASCRQEQRSYEHEDGQHGAFTYFLLDALQGGQGRRAVQAGTDYVTFHSLNLYVTAQVKNWAMQRGLSQLPNAQTALAGDPPLVELK